MEHSRGLHQLSIQQDIPPSPNEGPKAVDWLPRFSGFGWLAYGAHFTVVISMAPSPSNTGEAALGGVFQQILSTEWEKEDEKEKEHVSVVGWAPTGPSIGSLAAAAGKNIFIYGPEGLNSVEGNRSLPEVPLRWVNTQVLEHFSKVLSFSWSESGDGLLSVGQEILMWQKSTECWNCLWRSSLEQPHSLSAASWSARGIAATAGGVCTSVTHKQEDNADHLVKIWAWEDGKELQEVELSHPHQLLMIQWRPMRGFGSSSQSFRPVLLTCCQDGVVRLWAEIGNLGFPESRDSNFEKFDPSITSEEMASAYETQFKLAFFVSAVIDVNSTLKGILGHDIHVTWPEARGRSLRTSISNGDGSSGLVSTESEPAMNEWLVGIGPSGSITLWSVQSLDDLPPARGPLLQLWHQRSALLPSPSMPSYVGNVGIEGKTRLQSVKVVVHRPHSTILGPPSSLDVFEIWSPHLLRWSCIWPPVSAIGGRSAKAVASTSGPSNTSATGGRMSAWGVSSEIVVLGGHNGNIMQVAVHPIPQISLVASLDDRGIILLWVSNCSSLNPRLEIAGCLNPFWKLSSQLKGHQMNCTGQFNSLAWAPVMLSGNDAVLLLGHTDGVDCLLISRKMCVSKGKPTSFSISHNLLYRLDWPSSGNGQGLQGIYTFPHSTVNENSQIRSCVAVGVGGSGLKLASWKLDIELCHSNKKGSQLSIRELEGLTGLNELDRNDGSSNASAEVGEYTTHSDDEVAHGSAKEKDEGQNIRMTVDLLGSMNLSTTEHVTSICVRTSEHLTCRSLESVGEFDGLCDVVTGCADGVVRLWKVPQQGPLISVDSLENAVAWQCVGLLRFYSGPVHKVAICCGGYKVASIGNTNEETAETVHIWGADTFMEEKGFCLEGKLLLPSPAVSLSWLDAGNGLPILGVATQSHVKVFAECRMPLLPSGGASRSGLSEGNIWTCFAASSLTGFTLSSLSWEIQGSLIVTCGGHILLFFNNVLPLASEKLCSSSSGSSETSQTLSYGSHVRSVMRLHEVSESHQEKGLCSILEAAEMIGCPLLDYHPASILSWIFRDSRQYSRASIRHLAACLIPLSGSSSVDVGVETNLLASDSHHCKANITRTPLCKIFQDREQFCSLGVPNSTSIFASERSSENEGGRILDFLSPSSGNPFGDFTVRKDSYYGKNDQRLLPETKLVVKSGGFLFFTKVEVDMISNVVKDCSDIPQLSRDEKLQLLAIIDLLAEMDGVGQPSQIDSLDVPGRRFWLAVRYAYLEFHWRNDRNPHIRELVIESKAMAWALQSEFKEILLELCLSDQSASWSAMRALGMGYWFTDGPQLRKRMEKVARAQYLENKDPKDCTLLYLALDRRTVLAGLFKLSRDQKDKPLADFLLRDFKDEKNKVAALKNAYVLMGKHRHELAAAFFILGGDSYSAVVVCAKNLGDFQLALVISSLLEGVCGPMGRDVILKYALPSARKLGDGWLASLLQWSLGKGIESLKELSTESHNLSTPSTEKTKLSSERLNGYPVFPLDYEIGSYCALLASKPLLRTSAGAEEASAMARIATNRSTAAFKRTGLSLQALEYSPSSAQSGNLSKIGRGPNYDSFNFDGSSSASASTSPSRDVLLTDVSGREVGLCWVSAEVVSGMQRATRLNLVLKCASQCLQDHPHWGGEACTAWQHPAVSGLPSNQKENVTRSGSSNGHKDEESSVDKLENNSHSSSFSEEADKLFDDDLQLVKRKRLASVDKVAAALSTFTRIHHRPYLLLRLVQGLHRFTESPDMGFHMASMSAMSVSAAHYLEVFGTAAPWILARAVLACGGAAAGKDLSNCGKLTSGNYGLSKGGALLWCQIEELVRFGGEIQLLTSAASLESSLFDKGRQSRAMMLLSFVFFVTAAWLGRSTKVLFTLIAPTIIDPSAAPEVPRGDFDAVTWFRKLDFSNTSLRAVHGNAAGKKPLDTGGFNQAGTVTISGDDAWRVLGISLWTHLLIYVRKQLTGMASEALYSGFGRTPSSQSQPLMKSSYQGISSQPHPSMTTNTKGSTFLGFNLQSSALSSPWLDFKSKVRDSYNAHHSVTVASNGFGSSEGGPNIGKQSLNDGGMVSTTDTNDFGVALLSSLTSTVAGLRKQLAAHLEHSLNKSELDPLALWLWGKPSPVPVNKSHVGGNALNLFGGSGSSGLGGAYATNNADLYSKPQQNRFPTAVIGVRDGQWKELWDLLVVREKVCSALGLEGVSGQRSNQENDNISGSYLGRKGSVSTNIDSTRSGRDVITTVKLPPKRIMWNAAKGVPSVSDQGVTLSSWRQENHQARPQASEDSLHLSEEFSEWVDLRGHFR